MFFDHYPYTNFHNINLDWVLQAVKAWGLTVEANDQAFQDLKAANESFKAYVTNYLQDLDVSEEINDKLDQMLASGVLTPYFAPYVQGYVNSWLNSHVTPTSPALDNTLTLSGAAARADTTGSRLKDLAYIDALSTPEVYAAINRSQVMPGYRVQGVTYDYDGHFYVCGGSVDEDGTGVIVKMSSLDFKDAEMTVIQQLGHANDITYYNGYLYVCTVGGGDAPQWGIWKINVNDFTDKTLISNAPENTIGIAYRQGDFWILAPYRIYRTTDFTSYEVIVDNTNNLMTDYGIPTSGRISQTIFRAAGYLIGWVCSFVSEERHYGAITFFSSTGQPVAFKMFPAYHSELQGAVYTDMSIWLLADGNLVNVFRMDPRNLSYVQLKAGDDLNDFTGRGTLYSTGSNVSAELLNSPSSGEGFTVQVDRLGVYNTIQTARTNSGRELYRVKSFSAGTWGEWIEPAAEVAEIKEDLSDINSVMGRENLEYSSGYIDCNQSTINPDNVISSSSFRHVVDDCQAGDEYIINGTGSLQARSWCFINSSGARLSVQPTTNNYVCDNIKVVAPSNSAKFISNYWISHSTNPYAIKVTDSALKEEIFSESLVISGKYFETIPAGSDFNAYRNYGNYVVANVATAATILNIPANYGGRLTVIKVTSSTVYIQIYATTNGLIFWRSGNNNAWNYWHEIADEKKVNTEFIRYTDKGISNLLNILTETSAYNIRFANAVKPLELTNYIGNTQNVHPKVLYFNNSFGGHKYWMTYTPYPNSNDVYENPCIAYSDDGLTWKNIANNPLSTANGNGYNSDAHLVAKNDTLECWYRYVSDTSVSPVVERICRKTSSDGINWGSEETLHEVSGETYSNLLSPSPIWDGSKYCVWVVKSSVIEYCETDSNGKNWVKIRTLNIAFTDTGTTVTPWHIDVIKNSNGKYIILAMCRKNANTSGNKCSLFITTSDDNTAYTEPYIVIATGSNNWDNFLYRSSIVEVPSGYRIYYSAGTGGATSLYGGVWHIGISESATLENFRGIYV